MNRTVSLAAGVVLICLGVFVLLKGANVTSRKDVLTVGDVKITANESRSIPPWGAGIAVVAGIALVVAGARQRA
jgi:hypothetical protein